MATNSTSISTLKSAHVAAEVGGVSGLAGVPSPPGNASTWSRTSARAALAAGQIDQRGYNEILNALAVYEQTQYQNARDTEGSTGMLPQ
jgi:hypothetical protein